MQNFQDQVIASSNGSKPRISQAARMPIRVVLVDGDGPFLLTANGSLAEASDVACVAVLNGGNEAQQAVANLKPDVAILGTSMAGITGLALAGELKLRVPSLRIVMVAAPEDSRMVFEAMTAGVTGFLIKPVRVGELERAIRVAHSGGVPLCPASARILASVFRVPRHEAISLSSRQHAVMSCVVVGQSDKEIADRLHVEPSTVHAHLRRIFRKLGVHTRLAAARKYLGVEGRSGFSIEDSAYPKSTPLGRLHREGRRGE